MAGRALRLVIRLALGCALLCAMAVFRIAGLAAALAVVRLTVRFAVGFAATFRTGLVTERPLALTVRFAAGLAADFMVRLAAGLGATLTVRLAAGLAIERLVALAVVRLTVRLAAGLAADFMVRLAAGFAADFTVRLAAGFAADLMVRLAAGLAADLTVRFAAGLVVLLIGLVAGRLLAGLRTAGLLADLLDLLTEAVTRLEAGLVAALAGWFLASIFLPISLRERLLSVFLACGMIFDSSNLLWRRTFAMSTWTLALKRASCGRILESSPSVILTMCCCSTASRIISRPRRFTLAWIGG